MMKVHPVCQVMLDMIAEAPQPVPGADMVALARASLEAKASQSQNDPVDMASVEDRSVMVRDGHDVPVRIYTPHSVGAAPLPVIVYFHGGAWIAGSLGTHDGTCRHLADMSGCKLVSVDYRLAPEHKFPVGFDDCCDITEWIAGSAGSLGIDPSKIVLAGDSAGGNLAAAVALWARDYDGPKIAFQLLIYPVIDCVTVSGSRKDFAEGYFLTQPAMDWSTDQYVRQPAERGMWQVSPIYAERLAGLPPAHVITAGFDILKDEGIAYARALESAGVPTTHVDYPDVIHGFFGFGAVLEPAMDAMKRGCEEIRRVVR